MNILDHLTKLHAEAVPVPWASVQDEIRDGADHRMAIINGPTAQWAEDIATAALIVAMRNALPQLLAVAKAAQAVGVHFKDAERFEAIGEDRLERIEVLQRSLAALGGVKLS